MVIAGGMAILGGIGVYFGGPGQKDLGAGEKKVSESGWWELEKYFCGRVR